MSPTQGDPRHPDLSPAIVNPYRFGVPTDPNIGNVVLLVDSTNLSSSGGTDASFSSVVLLIQQ